VTGALALGACHPRPPGNQVQRELAGVDDVERSARGAPVDEPADLDAPPAFRLTGIVKARGQRTAMLEDDAGNALIVTRGDSVGQYRVDAVGNAHVELSRSRAGGGREHLRLEIE